MDLNRFFDPQSDEKDRRSIIESYKPAFLLLDKQATPNWQTIAREFDGERGQCRVFENEQYRLVRLDCEH